MSPSTLAGAEPDEALGRALAPFVRALVAAGFSETARLPSPGGWAHLLSEPERLRRFLRSGSNALVVLDCFTA